MGRVLNFSGIFVKCLVAAAALTAGIAEAGAKLPERPNVVLIGLDGWGSYSYDKADMPAVKHLAEEGCVTLKKRSVLPSSSAPNWASMFMGAPVELHGYTEWGSERPSMPSVADYRNGIFPTIFQVFRLAEPDAEIGVLYEWKGIKHLVDTLSLSFHALAPNYKRHPEALVGMAEEYIAEHKPRLLAVCFDNPDHVGHKAGHDTEEYYAKLAELDGYVGRILRSIDEAGMADSTIVIVTADHGGIYHNHGGTTMAEMETPFIISGPGIRSGYEIGEVMMQYDVAATIAGILGIDAPQVWTGRPLQSIFGD